MCCITLRVLSLGEPFCMRSFLTHQSYAYSLRFHLSALFYYFVLRKYQNKWLLQLFSCYTIFLMLYHFSYPVPSFLCCTIFLKSNTYYCSFCTQLHVISKKHQIIFIQSNLFYLDYILLIKKSHLTLGCTNVYFSSAKVIKTNIKYYNKSDYLDLGPLITLT